jgi:hypothetical protein
LADHRALAASSANRLETQRDANGLTSPARGFSTRPEQWEQPIEPGKHHTIHVVEDQPLWGFAPQHIELVSKDKDFTLQCSPRPEQANHGAQDQPEEIVHRDRLLPIRKKPSAVLGLR